MVLIKFLNSSKEKSTFKIMFPHYISAQKKASKGRPIKENENKKAESRIFKLGLFFLHRYFRMDSNPL